MQQGSNSMKQFDEQKFLKTYRGNEKFLKEEPEYYQAFLGLLNNRALLRYVKFANDVLGVPPLETFIRYSRDHRGGELFTKTMSRPAKQGLGACFAYLYRQMYSDRYVPEQCWFNDDATGIKTASRFVKQPKQEQ